MALPSGYTKLDYIQATGTQYIDTGVVVNKSDSYSMDIVANLTSSDNYAGCNGYMQFQAKIGNGVKSQIVINYKNTTETILVDGSQISSTSWSSYDGTNVKLGLFKMGDVNNGWFSGDAQSGKLYSCKISSGDTLIRDFIPCINADGVVGLYDQVGSQFYGNSGTGVFFASPQKQSLPSGYTQVEYIQSSGTQHIDTGYKAGSTTRLLMDFEPTSLASSHQMAAGVRNTTSGGNQFVIGWTGRKSPAVWRSDFGSSQVSFTTSISGAARHYLDKNGNVCTMDGTSVTNTAGSFTSAYTLCIFGGSTGGSVSQLTSMKLYSCKIYDGSTLVRNFVPCVNVSGVAGLYDMVGKQFYQNAGTGTFTAGDALPDASGVYVKINGTWKQVDNISVKAVT